MTKRELATELFLERAKALPSTGLSPEAADQAARAVIASSINLASAFADALDKQLPDEGDELEPVKPASKPAAKKAAKD